MPLFYFNDDSEDSSVCGEWHLATSSVMCIEDDCTEELGNPYFNYASIVLRRQDHIILFYGLDPVT